MPRPIDALPPALDAVAAIAAATRGRSPVLFLDYDGTLAPIVDRPEDARLDGATRALLERLARRRTVAIVSGRDLDDLMARVGLDRLYYAGSHGFRLAGPDGFRAEHPRAREFLPALGEAERALAAALAGVPGVQVERKRYAIAVHYRRAAEGAAGAVRRAAEAARGPALRLTEGRKVFELRPAIDWDKGRAVRFLLDRIAPDGAFALYVGDDLTDEDAFAAVAPDGAGVVVRGRAGETRAGFRLEDTGAVARFLEALDAALP